MLFPDSNNKQKLWSTNPRIIIMVCYSISVHIEIFQIFKTVGMVTMTITAMIIKDCMMTDKTKYLFDLSLLIENIIKKYFRDYGLVL